MAYGSVNVPGVTAADDMLEDILRGLLGGKLPDTTLANNSPEMIQKVAQLGLGENFWSVGDSVPIKLSGTVGAHTFENETFYAFILGFNHNPAIEGGIHFQFGKTSDGKDIAFTDGGYNSTGSTDGFRMNLEGTNSGGWENSYMRKTICPAFLASIEEAWRNIISPCVKYTDNVGGSLTEDHIPENITATKDSIWILGAWELFGEEVAGNFAEQYYQAQYTYYANGNSRKKFRHSSVSSACIWFLRSADTDEDSFLTINAPGNSADRTANYSQGFAPCFKVG